MINRQENDTPTIQMFDDILAHIGAMGRYQKFLIFILFPFSCASSVLLNTQFFITIIPEGYWCKVPEFENTNLTDWQKIELSIPFELKEDSTSERRTYSQCNIYIANYTEVLITGRRPRNDTPVDVCKNGWSFNQTSIPYLSISSELGWICDRSYLQNAALSTFFVGVMIGALVFGYIGDHYGRLPALIVCNGIGFLGSIATAFCNGFWTFAIVRLIAGSAKYNCLNIIFILVVEYTEPKYRTVVSCMAFGLYFATGAVLLPWIAYWVSNWRILSIVSSIPFTVVFITPFVIPESARWCIRNGQISRAIEILKKFAKVNKRNVAPEIYEDFEKKCELLIEDGHSKNYTTLHLFILPRLRRNFIVLIATWSLMCLIYIGIIWNMQLLYADVFTSYSVASTCEAFASVIVFFFIDRWGRRWMGFLSMFLCGIFLFIVIVTPVGSSAMWIAITARLGINVAANLNFQQSAEILPTVVRAQGLSLMIFTAAFIAIFSPNTFLLASIHPSLPFILMGSLSFVTAILILILPETMNQKLPDSLKDGNDFGKEQRFWWFPCIKSSSEKKKNYKRNVIVGNMDSPLLTLSAGCN